MEATESVRLVNVKQLSKALGVKESWVYQRTAEGSIPCVRVGRYVRFDQARVMRWLAAEQQAADVARAR